MLSLKNVEIGQIATMADGKNINRVNACIRNFKTHGMTKTKEYKVWISMKYRCYDKNCERYDRYGGRGIEVCDRWLHSFENFYIDMGDLPKGMTLDRINNNGNYCKENCRWATKQTQARNRSTSRLFDYKGRKVTLAELSDCTGIKRTTIMMRIDKYGWTLEQAITITPLYTNNRLGLV